MDFCSPPCPESLPVSNEAASLTKPESKIEMLRRTTLEQKIAELSKFIAGKVYVHMMIRQLVGMIQTSFGKAKPAIVATDNGEVSTTQKGTQSQIPKKTQGGRKPDKADASPVGQNVPWKARTRARSLVVWKRSSNLPYTRVKPNAVMVC